MGLFDGLKKKAQELYEFITPQNEQALRGAQNSINDANQRIQNARFGVLRAPQVRQQFVQDQQPQQFSLPSALLKSTLAAPVRVTEAAPYSVGRSLTGTAEGFSGLYDLVTPGTGTNRLTKGLVNAGGRIDQAARNAGVDPATYRALQATADAAQFVAPSATFEVLNKTGKVGKALTSTKPLIQGGKVMKFASTPSNLLNAGVATTRQQGYTTARGGDVSPKSVLTSAGVNLALGGALQGAGGKVADFVSKKVGDKPLEILDAKIDIQKNILKTVNDNRMRAKGSARATMDQTVLGEQKKLNDLIKERNDIINGGYARIPGKDDSLESLKQEGLKAYHGSTNNNLTSLEPGVKTGLNEKRNLIYLSEDKNAASNYAKNRGAGGLGKLTDSSTGRVYEVNVKGNVLDAYDRTQLDALKSSPGYERLSGKTKNIITNDTGLSSAQLEANPELVQFLKENGITALRSALPNGGKATELAVVDPSKINLYNQATAPKTSDDYAKLPANTPQSTPESPLRSQSNTQGIPGVSSKTNQPGKSLTSPEQLSDRLTNPTPIEQSPLSNIGSVSQRNQKSAGSTYNLSKSNVDNTTKAKIEQQVVEMQPEIEQAVGRKLSLQEAKEYAKTGDKVLGSVRNRSQTLDDIAALERTQQRFLALKEKEASGKALSPKEVQQMARDLLSIQAKKADVARQLGSMRNTIDPKELTMRDLMLQKIAKEVDDMNPVFEAMKKYDLNNPKQATEFYRQFVKPTAENWFDKYRYTNMLSSPWTHMVNMSSNLTGGAVVRPIQKIYEGFIDSLNGGDKTRYSGEAFRYWKGFFGSLGEAVDSFKGVFDDSRVTQNPDFDSLMNVALATKGAAGTADKIIGFVPKLLEAGDQFGQALVRGGETASLKFRQGKGVNVGNIVQQANDTAKYQMFRNQLNNKSEGHILRAIDFIPGVVNQARSAENPVVRLAAKATFPFVSTPTNIVKQMIEYSPAGATTIPGAADKTAQAAKTLMGITAVATIAGTAGANGNITFTEPSGEDRDKFRAEGKQAYSIKIGDKWFSYQRLHPAIAFNFAIVGAVHDAVNNGKLDESGAEKVFEAAGNMSRFITDQSYFKNVKDFVDVVTATESNAKKFSGTIASQAANYAGQVIPFRALQSWVNSLIDTTQRKVDYTEGMPTQIYQQVAKQLPGLSKTVPERTNPYTGQPLTNDYPFANALSPVRITQDKGYGNTTGLNAEQSMQYRDLPLTEKDAFKNTILTQKAEERTVNQEKEKIKTQDSQTLKTLSNGKVYLKIGDEYKTFDTPEEAELAKTKDAFINSSEKSKIIGDKYYYKPKSWEKGDTLPSKSKSEYEYDKTAKSRSIKMDTAYEKNDLKGYVKLAEEEYNALEKTKEQYDPETEQDKIDAISLKQQNLAQRVQRYVDRGYTKRGRTGRKGRKGSAKLAVLSDQTVKPIVKTASSPTVRTMRTPRRMTVKARKF